MKSKDINELIIKSKSKPDFSTKEISDGHHTFGDLYEQRVVLFSVICNQFPDMSWKSKKHYDEEDDLAFDGCFICGINTSEGVATYHFKEVYWDLFDIPEIPKAPQYDGYTEKDVMMRILTLNKNKNNDYIKLILEKRQ